MDRKAAKGVLATISLHSSRLSAFIKVSLSSNPVQSVILSSHLFFCLPLSLPPCTVPCYMVFASSDDLVTCPYHISFRCLIVVRRTSWGPMACLILFHTSSLVYFSFLTGFHAHLIHTVPDIRDSVPSQVKYI